MAPPCAQGEQDAVQRRRTFGGQVGPSLAAQDRQAEATSETEGSSLARARLSSVTSTRSVRIMPLHWDPVGHGWCLASIILYGIETVKQQVGLQECDVQGARWAGSRLAAYRSPRMDHSPVRSIVLPPTPHQLTMVMRENNIDQQIPHGTARVNRADRSTPGPVGAGRRPCPPPQRT